MPRPLAALAVLAVTAVAPAQEPKFSFVESETTKKHIAVQPKDEHHRVYFPLRVENMKGKTVFARVRCQPDGDESASVQAVRFKPTTDNDLWRVYLRAPRHEDRTATYQVEVGVYDPSALDPEMVRGAFGWKVTRSNGQAAFVTSESGADGQPRPVGLPLTVRKAVIQGGSIKIVSEMVTKSAPVDLKFGLDDTTGKDIKVDGSGAILVK